MTTQSYTFNYNDLISSIKSVAQGKNLSFEQEQALSALNTTIHSFQTLQSGYTALNRKAATFATQRWVLSADHNFTGDITYTGSQTYTGTVILGDSTSVSKQDLNNELMQFNGCVKETFSNNPLSIPLIGTNTGLVKSLYDVLKTSNYYLFFNGSNLLENGTVREYTIVNNASSPSSSPKIATGYSTDGINTMNFTKSTTVGSSSNGCVALQKITITKISGIVKVYSIVTYLN